MGAGNPQGSLTNGEKVAQIIGQSIVVGRDIVDDPSPAYMAQQICDALGVDPEGEWSAPFQKHSDDDAGYSHSDEDEFLRQH